MVGQQIVRQLVYGLAAVSPLDGHLCSLAWGGHRGHVHPYNPELNPVEHLWDHLRDNYIGNRLFASLDEVIDQLCVGLRQLHQQPKLIRSMI